MGTLKDICTLVSSSTPYGVRYIQESHTEYCVSISGTNRPSKLCRINKKKNHVKNFIQIKKNGLSTAVALVKLKHKSSGKMKTDFLQNKVL